MKKNTAKKLKISKKTVATLNRTEMNAAKGGNTQTACTTYQTGVGTCPTNNTCGLPTNLTSKATCRTKC
jgi:hypothetical protein